MELLAQTGDHLVLTRLPASPPLSPPPIDGRQLYTGMLVDLETTGLDKAVDIPFQTGYVLFRFCEEGRIYDILDLYSGMQDPGVPLSEKVQEVTGYNDDDVRGRIWDQGRIEAAFDSADLCIAHNANFDRVMCEKTFQHAASKAWACSQREVPWSDQFGVNSAKLDYLLAFVCQAFYRGHDALIDAQATLYLLTHARGKDGRTALAMLIERSKTNALRVYLTHAIFERKDALKSHGCTWFDGSTGLDKAWFMDLPFDAQMPAALDVLWDMGYERGEKATVNYMKLTAKNRHRDHPGRHGAVARARLSDVIGRAHEHLVDLGLIPPPPQPEVPPHPGLPQLPDPADSPPQAGSQDIPKSTPAQGGESQIPVSESGHQDGLPSELGPREAR